MGEDVVRKRSCTAKSKLNLSEIQPLDHLMLPDMHGTSVLVDFDCFGLALELMHGTSVQPIVFEQSQSESTEHSLASSFA